MTIELPKKSVLWSVIGLFSFLLLIVYGHALGFDFVHWDDGILIYENPAVRGITLQNLKTVFTTYDPELYIPFTLITYQIDYMIGGINPAIYHFHSLALHILNSLLVTLLLKNLLRHNWVALFAGLIFALHPLNVEAVVWASARKDLLSTAFFLLSILGYMSFRTSQKKSHYYISIALFACALLSKVTVIGLPILLLLIDWKENRLWEKGILAEKIPYFALSFLFGFIAIFGKTTVLGSSSLEEKILIPIKSIIFYIEKFILPTKLSVLYPIASDINLHNPMFLLPLIALIALSIGVIYSLKKTKIFFFGFVWFAICVGPTLLNFFKGDFLYYASDRYAYTAMIGLLFILSWCFIQISQQKWIVGLCIAMLFGYSIGTIRQVSSWENTYTLFQHAIKNYPNAAAAGYNNVGNYVSLQYREDGKLEEAIELYTKALEISQTHSRNVGETNPGVSKILSNLASAYRQQGDMVKSLETYKESLRINPINTHALLGLGTYYNQQGQTDLAESYYYSAIEANPHFVTSYVNLGSLYVQAGRYDDAVDILETGVDYNPFYPQAQYNLAVALRKIGRNAESLARLETAVKLEPSFVAARINLGIQYAERQRIQESIDQFKAVLQYDPSNARARSAIQQLENGR